MSIRRLLVANRGEIARRVFRTCRELGIETVAVHSEADAALPFVAEADLAVALPGSAPSEIYLRGDLVVDAAVRAGADAVHPGYGFLSENADFARRVSAAGLTWVGPTPESIEQMGSKVRAKKLMADAGVPVLGELEPAEVTDADLPLLVKASAGGGGRGMRVVRRLDELSATVQQASDEAASAFGDATVFCEPYVEQGRHVEVQVWADANANVSVLGERDCSVQRRHQKVIEEAPAPGLPDRVRTALQDAARTAAEAIGYVGAGTVEFLYDGARQSFWFLETNTRLQVEHPVTELVTGVDLVALQIRAAEGGTLSLEVAEPTTHAVEARLYAEDPAHDWQPQSGRLAGFEVPGVLAEFGPLPRHGIRLDAGFAAGDEIGTHYDAMLAKVVAWGETREDALRRLAGALQRARIHGVRTNRDLLVEVLRHPAMVDADVATDFLERHDLRARTPRPVAEETARLSALAAALAGAERARLARAEQRRIPAGWRSVTSGPQRARFLLGEAEVEVGWYGGREGYRAADDLGVADVVVHAASTARVELSVGGVTHRFDCFLDRVGTDGSGPVDVESPLGHVALHRLPRFLDPAEQVAPGSLLAPMPGTVVRVDAEQGQRVTGGQPVLVLEAMKMQHTVAAPHDGVLTELPVAEGDQVAGGAVLAVVPAGTTDDATAPTHPPDEGDRP